jgi:hypothetical protein
MSAYQSSPIQLNNGVTADVKADADGMTVGFQSDGVLLIDVNVTDMGNAALLIDALDRGMTHCLAAREGV